MVSIFEEIMEGLDVEELKTVDGMSRYKFDLKNGRIYDCDREIYLDPKPNKRNYCYVNLQKDDKSRKVASVHSLMIYAALEGFDFRKLFKGMNLVIDHKNRKRFDNSWGNLHVIPQSKNLEGRKTKPKRLSDDKMQALYNDFILIDKAKHGSKHDTYNYLADRYGCSSHTIQVKYLEYKKAQ
ncbi:hypothetical protein [Lysinibacillus sp. NPDC086135]|uniref:hypothetical protein n=1 Tax=Lysinibacillus sp. NPDC086135 TaxID=3364130 RepID=UPI00380AA7E5